MEAEIQHVLQEALAAEDDAEPGLLLATVRRMHVHYTHVSTNDSNHVQPGDMTREQFWNHLAKVYAEVYPDCTSPTGSILLFGLVAQEEHQGAVLIAHNKTHKHCATFSTRQHYWSKVAKHSLQRYSVPLNAVAHSTYATMYA